MKVKNNAMNNIIAGGTDNVIIPTAAQQREGIVYKSNLNSNIPNGFFYNLSEAIQFLQFTNGLYDANAEYSEGNICKLLYKDNSGYQLKSFRRNNKHNSILKANPPFKNADIETTNGIDCYMNGEENEDWEEIKSGLSAYIFQIEGKTIDDLLDNNYTKDNINQFLTIEKFNELYQACVDFTQVYFLDCLVSYKTFGEYADGSSETGDLKKYMFVELNINKNGAINIRFDYNLTDNTYSKYYSQGLNVSGKSLINIQAVTSDLQVADGQDKNKVIPNMAVIQKINTDIQVISQSECRELVIDLDLQFESNIEQSINLLSKIQEKVPNASKVNFWELIYWQSAREKQLEANGWESGYLIKSYGSFDLARNQDGLNANALKYGQEIKLAGDINLTATAEGTTAVNGGEAYTYLFALQNATATAMGYGSSSATAMAYAYARASATATGYGSSSGSATATAYAYAYARASASATGYGSSNGKATATAVAASSASAVGWAVSSSKGKASAVAYAKKNAVCYNYIDTPSSSILRVQLANENKYCQINNNTKAGNYIDNDYNTSQMDIYYNQDSEKVSVPIIVYKDTFTLKYTYKKYKADGSGWDADLNTGDKLLFKPKLLINYQ